MSTKLIDKTIIRSLMFFVTILLISCSDGDQDSDDSTKAFSDAGLIGTWEGECQLNNGNIGGFKQRVREFRSDQTFSFIINNYIDADCSQLAITSEFVGRYSGGEAIDNSEEGVLIQIDSSYESAFITLHSQQIVDQFNLQKFDCPTSSFTVKVNYDVTNCNTTFEDRPLPVVLFSVLKIVDNDLGFSPPAFSDNTRNISVRELEFKRASNTL